MQSLSNISISYFLLPPSWSIKERWLTSKKSNVGVQFRSLSCLTTFCKNFCNRLFIFSLLFSDNMVKSGRYGNLGTLPNLVTIVGCCTTTDARKISRWRCKWRKWLYLLWIFHWCFPFVTSIVYLKERLRVTSSNSTFKFYYNKQPSKRKNTKTQIPLEEKKWIALYQTTNPKLSESRNLCFLNMRQKVLKNCSKQDVTPIMTSNVSVILLGMQSVMNMETGSDSLLIRIVFHC